MHGAILFYADIRVHARLCKDQYNSFSIKIYNYTIYLAILDHYLLVQ